MRLFVSIIATAIFFAASAASAAVTFTVDVTSDSGRPLDLLEAGDTITLDITMRSDGTPTFAIGASVFGYEPGSLTLVGGVTSSAALVQFATGPGTGFGGLDSTQAVASVGPRETQFFNGVSISGTPATGVGDISPVTGVAGGPHARITFTVNAATSFRVGADAAFGDAIVGQGGAFLTANNADIAVALIPEPGTALLMGLGLAGLAAAGRRETN